jgi:hypothetical protein
MMKLVFPHQSALKNKPFGFKDLRSAQTLGWRLSPSEENHRPCLVVPSTVTIAADFDTRIGARNIDKTSAVEAA